MNRRKFIQLGAMVVVVYLYLVVLLIQLPIEDDNLSWSFINKQSAIFIKILSEEAKLVMIKNTNMMIKIANDMVKSVDSYLENKDPNPARDYNWEYNLIDSPQVNAFCAPGGKIAVYTGILKYTQNKDGLAAVWAMKLHAAAKHNAEE